MFSYAKAAQNFYQFSTAVPIMTKWDLPFRALQPFPPIKYGLLEEKSIVCMLVKQNQSDVVIHG